MPMSSKWFWAHDGQKNGPVESTEIHALARSGRLLPTDLIWKEGLADWVEARKVKGLFPDGPPALPPRVPPITNYQSNQPPPPMQVMQQNQMQGQGFQPPGGNPAITGCCPKCGQSVWKSHLGCAVFFLIVLFFPLGLLLLLVPRRWECISCHYSYTSSQRPFGFSGSMTSL